MKWLAGKVPKLSWATVLRAAAGAAVARIIFVSILPIVRRCTLVALQAIQTEVTSLLDFSWSCSDNGPCQRNQERNTRINAHIHAQRLSVWLGTLQTYNV